MNKKWQNLELACFVIFIKLRAGRHLAEYTFRNNHWNTIRKTLLIKRNICYWYIIIQWIIFRKMWQHQQHFEVQTFVKPRQTTTFFHNCIWIKVWIFSDCLNCQHDKHNDINFNDQRKNSILRGLSHCGMQRVQLVWWNYESWVWFQPLSWSFGFRLDSCFNSLHLIAWLAFFLLDCEW